MGPDKSIPASELFLKLMETPRPTELVDYPRKDENGNPVGKLRIQVLTQEEHDRARIAAHRSMREQGLDNEDLKGNAVQEVLGDTVARELLAMACLTENGPDDGNGRPMYGRIFQDAKDLKKIRSDEIAVLFQSYMATQAKYGPYESIVGDEAELNAWVKRLVEGGSGFPLLRLPLPALLELTSLLAQKIYTASKAVDSLWSSLPDTLKSSLEMLRLEFTLSGEQVVSSIQSGSES